jgi:transcription elongation GreA/GreB family factor
MGREKAEHLTPEQRAALEAELAELEGPRRAAAVQAIKTAREYGDLSENFEYHAAKHEQGLLEARIRTLRHRIQHELEVEISSVGGVSPDSPLGRALMGAGVGDVVAVDAPRGAWHARVLAIRRP